MFIDFLFKEKETGISKDNNEKSVHYSVILKEMKKPKKHEKKDQWDD